MSPSRGSRDRYVRALIEALRSHPRAEKRLEAAWLLGKLSDPRAVPALIEVLHGREDPYIEMEAAAALGRMDDERAREALVQVLTRASDPPVTVRLVAVEGLRHWKSDPCVQVALEKTARHDLSPRVREAAQCAMRSH
jgi:HEAT repeat protein